jgi:hypothetical protein
MQHQIWSNVNIVPLLNHGSTNEHFMRNRQLYKYDILYRFPWFPSHYGIFNYYLIHCNQGIFLLMYL